MGDQVTLGIDTSAGIAVGLAADGTVLAGRWLGDSRQHVERVLPMIDEALVDAGSDISDVGSVIVGMGPGPFTGLRVGIAAAQALAAALGAGIRGVCSLDAIAAAVPTPQAEFCVLSDARRGEVYWARYSSDGVRLGEPRVGPAEALPHLALAGPGTELSAELAARVPAGWPVRTDGGALAAVGARLPQLGPEPLYLRHADATAPTSRKSTLANRAGRVRLRGPR